MRIASFSIWYASAFVASSAFELITLRANSIDPLRGGGADVAIALGASCAMVPTSAVSAAVSRSPGAEWGVAGLVGVALAAHAVILLRLGNVPLRIVPHPVEVVVVACVPLSGDEPVDGGLNLAEAVHRQEALVVVLLQDFPKPVLGALVDTKAIGGLAAPARGGGDPNPAGDLLVVMDMAEDAATELGVK